MDFGQRPCEGFSKKGGPEGRPSIYEGYKRTPRVLLIRDYVFKKSYIRVSMCSFLNYTTPSIDDMLSLLLGDPHPQN